MKKKLFLGFLILVLMLVPFAYAVDTNIYVETLSNHDVSILVLENSEVYNLLEMFNNRPSGQHGNVSAVYASSGRDKINIQIIIKENGKGILSKKFTDIPTGTPAYLKVLPDWAGGDIKTSVSAPNVTNVTTHDNSSEIVNDTNSNKLNLINTNSTNNAINTTNSENKSTNGISGFSISKLNISFLKSWIFWVVLGIIIVFLLLVIFKNKLPKLSPHQHKSYPKSNVVKVNTKSGESINVKSKSPTNPADISISISEAEQKIKDAQDQINKLKNEARIKELEDKMKRDRDELDKLRGGI